MIRRTRARDALIVAFLALNLPLIVGPPARMWWDDFTPERPQTSQDGPWEDFAAEPSERSRPSTPAVLTAPSVVGVASWYDGAAMEAAAGPALRVGNWRGRTVHVCDAGQTCVSVRLTDWCQCHAGSPRERIIDLRGAAFRRLAPLHRGLVEVSVTWS